MRSRGTRFLRRWDAGESKLEKRSTFGCTHHQSFKSPDGTHLKRECIGPLESAMCYVRRMETPISNTFLPLRRSFTHYEYKYWLLLMDSSRLSQDSNIATDKMASLKMVSNDYIYLSADGTLASFIVRPSGRCGCCLRPKRLWLRTI